MNDETEANSSFNSRGQSNYFSGQPQVDRRFNSLNDGSNSSRASNEKDNEIIELYDKRLGSWLVNMHNTLRQDKIDSLKVGELADILKHMKDEQETDYIEALIHPEVSKGAKIPSSIPIPSSSFQLRSSTIVTTNATGNAAIFFNPNFLSSAAGVNSTLFVNNNVGLTGSASNNFFTATNIGQSIPNVYSQYRVVSATMVVKYFGRLDIVQGVIGGSVIFDPNVTDVAAATVNANLAKYGDFNLAMDAYYTQENMALQGLRTLYFPLDVTYEKYENIGVSHGGFGMFCYIYNGVPSSPSYKVDVYVNYECLPDSAFLNYIPTSPCDKGHGTKEEAIRKVQSKPITDALETQSYRKNSKERGFVDWIQDIAGGLLPSVSTIASMLIPQGKFLAPLAQLALNSYKK